MPNANEISSEFEGQRYNYILWLNGIIEAEFGKYISAITNYALANYRAGTPFTYDDYPAVKIYVDNVVQQLVGSIESRIVVAIGDSWQMSLDKNDKILQQIDESFIGIGTQAALKAFQSKEQLKLSENIYDNIKPFVNQVESGLQMGLSNGDSAVVIGSDLKMFLKNPDALFRRQRNAQGDLVLSKPARDYHPGQGVYRSATKNIERLTREVINNAYRTADLNRWQSTPLVLGYRVNTSAQHPKNDICDDMKGDYPDTFIFSGWHVQCLCYSVPILMNTDQFAQYQALVLSGNDTPENVARIAKPVTGIPKSAQGWVVANRDKLERLKNAPYWYTDNAVFFENGK